MRAVPDKLSAAAWAFIWNPVCRISKLVLLDYAINCRNDIASLGDRDSVPDSKLKLIYVLLVMQRRTLYRRSSEMSISDLCNRRDPASSPDLHCYA